MLTMKIGLLTDACRTLPDVLESGIHCVRTQWIRGFMAFHRARHARTVMLMVPVCTESSFRERAAWSRSHWLSGSEL